MLLGTCSCPDLLEASGVAEPLAAHNGTTAAAPTGTTAIDHDPSRAAETRLLGAVQRRLHAPAVVRVARGMSLFGEHAAGWLAIGVLGAAVDRPRRRDWLYAAGGVAVAHGASIAVKRVVRRPRPNDPAVQVLVGTPSRLSFPSSHASSTTAAAVLFGALLGRRLTPALVPPMLLSRLVLGVHFPTDVLAGSALGATVAALTPRLARWRRTVAPDAVEGSAER
jgi:membrane-associated phospholipid phosphatase